jgi:hypothetical protein
MNGPVGDARSSQAQGSERGDLETALSAGARTTAKENVVGLDRPSGPDLPESTGCVTVKTGDRGVVVPTVLLTSNSGYFDSLLSGRWDAREITLEPLAMRMLSSLYYCGKYEMPHSYTDSIVEHAEVVSFYQIGALYGVIHETARTCVSNSSDPDIRFISGVESYVGRPPQGWSCRYRKRTLSHTREQMEEFVENMHPDSVIDLLMML